MGISIFNKSDSDITIDVSRLSKAKAEEMSFENFMKSASSSDANSPSEPGNIAIKPGFFEASDTERKNDGINGGKKDGNHEVGVKEKTLSSDNEIAPGASKQSAELAGDASSHPVIKSDFLLKAGRAAESTNIIEHGLIPPVEGEQKTAKMISPKKDGNFQARRGKDKKDISLSERNIGSPKVQLNDFEEARKSANIAAPALLLPANKPQSTDFEEKGNDSSNGQKSTDSANAGAVELKLLPARSEESSKCMETKSIRPLTPQEARGNAPGSVLQGDVTVIKPTHDLNGESSKQGTQADERILKVASKDFNRGKLEMHEAFTPEKKANTEDSQAGKKDKEPPKGIPAQLIAKKPNSGQILPSADDKKKVDIETTDLKAGFDGGSRSAEDSSTHKNAKSPEHVDKTISTSVVAKDEFRTPVDNGRPGLRLNLDAAKEGAINGFDSSNVARGSKNEDNAGKKDFTQPEHKVSTDMGQAPVDRISTNPPASVAKTVQSARDTEVFDKVADGLKMSLAQGGKEVRLSLHPEQLGKLNIKLVVEESTVKARIQVDNSAVKGILESDAGRLKEFFSRQGLVLEKYSIEVSQHGSNMNHSGGFNGGGFPEKSYGGDGRRYVGPDAINEDSNQRPFSGSMEDNSTRSGIDVFI